MRERSMISHQVQEIERVSSTMRDDNIIAIAIYIGKKLDSVRPALLNTYICKVHQELRLVNEKAYEPVLLSIGPYHYNKRASNLKCMEEHKLRYLSQLVKQVGTNGSTSRRTEQLEGYLMALKELENEAREYYAEAIDLDQHEFLEMLLLDGFFIIELFRRFEQSKHAAKIDPLFKENWILMTLARDLLLIENQLPFFVLEKLRDMIEDNPSPLYQIALNFFYYNFNLPLDKKTFEKGISFDLVEVGDIKHLLDLARKSMLIDKTSEKKHKTDQLSREAERHSQKKYTYLATELRDLGVKFKCIEEGKFRDIKFKNWELELPIIRVTDTTEVLFRNLIAYEEHAYSNDVKYVTDYMTFMDGVIDSAKDVEFLRHKGIIDSFVSSDEEISTMFNKMNNNIIITETFYYNKIVHDLGEIKHHRVPRWNVALRRNYLNNPWAILSIIAAFVLLTCTLMQTIYATLSYYMAHSKPLSLHKSYVG